MRVRDRVIGGGLIAVAIIGLSLGMFVLGALAGYASDPRNVDVLRPDEFPLALALLLSHRALFGLLCAPALVGGIMLAANARPRAAWYALGLIGAAVMLGALLLCFIAFLAPLYQYQEL